jgi:hypothetical protein
MASIAKKCLLWAAVAFLFLVLFWAARNGVAQLFLLSARADMDSLSELQRSPSESDSDSVMSKLEWAVRLADADPAPHENIARLNLMRAATISDSNKHRQILREGLNQIHIALALNPSSPYPWTVLLMLKRDLGEFDAEFRYALHRAVELGPWEPTLLLAQADVGLSAWDAMQPEEQTIIQQIFVRGMQRQSKAMQDVAESHRPPCKEGVTCQ